jgi:hypothetical protein
MGFSAWRLYATLLVMLVIVQLAHAEPVSVAGLQVIGSSTRTISGISNISAQGGNVTELRIDALTVTKTWQGYFGNVTGNIHLDDANNNSFYVWGNATSLSGEIYAARNSSIQWATINCTNSTQRTAEEAYLGVNAVDGDSITNTYGGASHPAFNVGLRPITANSCYNTNVYVNGSSQNASFYQVLLSDYAGNASNIVYATLIENDEFGYNGRQMDFQLMVGENEHDGNSGPTTYYFFVELS